MKPTQSEIVQIARDAGIAKHGLGWTCWEGQLERFAERVAAAERKACADAAGEFARRWWGIHCESNKHLETSRRAHEDFCALQSAIRARGNV